MVSHWKKSAIKTYIQPSPSGADNLSAAILSIPAQRFFFSHFWSMFGVGFCGLAPVPLQVQVMPQQTL